MLAAFLILVGLVVLAIFAHRLGKRVSARMSQPSDLPLSTRPTIPPPPTSGAPSAPSAADEVADPRDEPPVAPPVPPPVERPPAPTAPAPSPPPSPPAQDPWTTGSDAPALFELLEGIRFPDDMGPVTFGMTPADLHSRLVLSTRRLPADLRAWLDTTFGESGYQIAWVNEYEGVARSERGGVHIAIHPPLPPPEPSESKRKPLAQVRQDFPSAAPEATVVSLTVATGLV